MSQYALLYYTLMRLQKLDSPETARRREHQVWLEGEARETRLHRRGIIRRGWNVLRTFHRDGTRHGAHRHEARAAREALR